MLPSSVHERYSAWVQAQLDRTAPDPLTPAISQPCPLFFLSFFFFNYPSSLIWGVHVVLIVWQSTEAWSTHKGGSGRRPLGKLPLPHSQPTVHSSSVGVWSEAPLAWSLRAVRPDSIQQPQLLCVPECWGPVLSRRHRFVLILPDPGLSQSF